MIFNFIILIRAKGNETNEKLWYFRIDLLEFSLEPQFMREERFHIADKRGEIVEHLIGDLYRHTWIAWVAGWLAGGQQGTDTSKVEEKWQIEWLVQIYNGI